MKNDNVYYKSGREGPRHDPYSYEEWTVEKNGDEIVLHLGLGVFLKVNGREVMRDQGKDSYDDGMLKLNPHIKWGYKDVVAEFEKRVGMTLVELDAKHNTYNVPRKCPKCGNMDYIDSEGFAGEPMLECDRCGTIVWSHPDPLKFVE